MSTKHLLGRGQRTRLPESRPNSAEMQQIMEAERRHPASGLRREIGRRSLLQAIPSVLKWKNSDEDFHRRVNDTHLATVRLHVQALGERGSRFRSVLSDMPPAMRRRIELAPEVYRLVRYATDRSVPEVCEALERFCAVEKHIEGGRSVAPGTSRCWSALGDVCVNGNGDESIPDTACSRRPARDLTFAPGVRQTVIDGYSPFHAEIVRGARIPVESYRAGEFREVVARLFSAFKFIESACAPACAMLDARQRVVVLVRTPDHPNSLISRSTRDLPGLAAFFNLHSSAWHPTNIVDHLVHEGIHALLYKTTLSGTFFTRQKRGTITAVSPWTGRRLTLGSFVQACFVWYGLWNFWKQASPQSKRGRHLAERARKGFESEPFLDHIPREGLAILEPDVVEAIRSMAAEANG